MSVENKIQRLIEESLNHLQKEIRYIITLNNFQTIKNKNRIDERTDWYFSGYRVRKLIVNDRVDWFKINNNQSSLVTKVKQRLPEQDIKNLDELCNFKLEIYSKRPVVNGKELYLEKVDLTKDNKLITYYTTETETISDEKNIQLLRKIPQITSIENIGDTSMEQLAEKIYRKKGKIDVS